MKTLISLILIVILVGSVCYADSVRGTIEKVDLKKQEIVVGGTNVDILKATIFTENDMGVTKNIITRDIKDHKGEYAVCYGSLNKNNIFSAYKVKIREGHR